MLLFQILQVLFIASIIIDILYLIKNIDYEYQLKQNIITNVLAVLYNASILLLFDNDFILMLIPFIFILIFTLIIIRDVTRLTTFQLYRKIIKVEDKYESEKNQ